VTRLNQIVALEPTVKQNASREIAALLDAVVKEAPLSGLTRTYEPANEDGLRRPAESKQVQFTVNQILDGVATRLTRVMDLTLTKDEANTKARADVKVGDTVIASDVPVTNLLFLEKQLNLILAALRTITVLDPNYTWMLDPATNTWVTEPVATLSTDKVEVPLVLYEATKEHPAQVKTTVKDVPVGTWTQRKFSGAIQRARKDQLIERCNDLIAAVKSAREEANSITVVDRQVGAAIFEYLYAS
jgi:hypothetical protein